MKYTAIVCDGSIIPEIRRSIGDNRVSDGPRSLHWQCDRNKLAFVAFGDELAAHHVPLSSSLPFPRPTLVLVYLFGPKTIYAPNLGTNFRRGYRRMRSRFNLFGCRPCLLYSSGQYRPVSYVQGVAALMIHWLLLTWDLWMDCNNDDYRGTDVLDKCVSAGISSMCCREITPLSRPS